MLCDAVSFNTNQHPNRSWQNSPILVSMVLFIVIFPFFNIFPVPRWQPWRFQKKPNGLSYYLQQTLTSLLELSTSCNLLMLNNFDATVSCNKMNGVSVSATLPSHHLFLHYVSIYHLSLCLSKKTTPNLTWTQFDSQNSTYEKTYWRKWLTDCCPCWTGQIVAKTIAAR